MKTFKFLFMTGLLAFTFTSCEPDPDPVQEEELITTLQYTLTPIGGGAPVVFTFKDIDGDGGNAPVVTNGVIDGSKEYSGSLVLTNESITPAEDITAEILEESADHQFFFEPSSTLATVLKIDYADVDAGGKPLGLKSKVSTTGVGKGQLVITLRHEPNKSGVGVANGSIANAGGETDIQVSFNVEIK
jgi:hypothetical protein